MRYSFFGKDIDIKNEEFNREVLRIASSKYIIIEVDNVFLIRTMYDNLRAFSKKIGDTTLKIVLCRGYYGLDIVHDRNVLICTPSMYESLRKELPVDVIKVTVAYSDSLRGEVTFTTDDCVSGGLEDTPKVSNTEEYLGTIDVSRIDNYLCCSNILCIDATISKINDLMLEYSKKTERNLVILKETDDVSSLENEVYTIFIMSKDITSEQTQGILKSIDKYIENGSSIICDKEWFDVVKDYIYLNNNSNVSINVFNLQ